MGSPRCALSAEYPDHFVWEHDCLVSTLDAANGEVTKVVERTSTVLPKGADGWTIEQPDPLTISPSIWCHACDTHGWWRYGAWVSA